MSSIQRLKTITEFHRTRQLPPPEHPLISIVDYAQVHMLPEYQSCRWVFDFYFISLKKNIDGKIRYGQQSYDFDEGVMFFIAPGQVFGIERGPGTPPADKSGWMLLVHPDFLWSTPLAGTIARYEFFGYAINEALFVSAKEEETLMGVVTTIKQEYHTRVDQFSQRIIAAQIETLLQYAARFYSRQFLTRRRTGHQVLDRLEALAAAYFSDDGRAAGGLPTVRYFAEQLHLSPKYLTSLLKALTGQTVQQVIHDQVIKQAKRQLSTTDLSVSEIAYGLGFEHPQSFSKLFRQKTALSPQDFRKGFQGN